MPEHRLTVAEALARLPGAAGERYVELFQHGTLSVELYAPRGSDPQNPHTRDEVYVVVQGSGQFRNGDARHPFGPGDLLFVPAGVGLMLYFGLPARDWWALLAALEPGTFLVLAAVGWLEQLLERPAARKE